jgi:hypothetical protein
MMDRKVHKDQWGLDHKEYRGRRVQQVSKDRLASKVQLGLVHRASQEAQEFKVQPEHKVIQVLVHRELLVQPEHKVRRGLKACKALLVQVLKAQPELLVGLVHRGCRVYKV